ncbi:hypothetical protein [Erythrobacter litoralis]|uniref:hypothetical protein n=1 Tax=Erythrobacter litoralis TaxID=39960 RepID=UPI0024354BD8|nr:hypothetical protein [Erythrobacter litoralis]
MKKRNSPMIWIGVTLIVVGILIDVFSTSYVIGTALIVVGALLVALQAGKGKPKGGESDH